MPDIVRFHIATEISIFCPCRPANMIKYYRGAKAGLPLVILHIRPVLHMLLSFVWFNYFIHFVHSSWDQCHKSRPHIFSPIIFAHFVGFLLHFACVALIKSLITSNAFRFSFVERRKKYYWWASNNGAHTKMCSTKFIFPV